MKDAVTQPSRIRYFKIALSKGTVELPWPSRTRLLDRVGKHSGGLKVRLAFEAVGATRPVVLDTHGKRVQARSAASNHTYLIRRMSDFFSRRRPE